MVLPLVLPPVVGGVALLSAFGRRGLVGQWLYDWVGVQLPFSTAGVVLAETFVAMPFLVLTVEAALRGSDRRLEAVAATLGASPLTVFRRVSLPMVAPAIVAGTVLAWARALGEFGATITFAGNFPGQDPDHPAGRVLGTGVGSQRRDRTQRPDDGGLVADPGAVASPLPRLLAGAGAAMTRGTAASGLTGRIQVDRGTFQLDVELTAPTRRGVWRSSVRTVRASPRCCRRWRG